MAYGFGGGSGKADSAGYGGPGEGAGHFGGSGLGSPSGTSSTGKGDRVGGGGTSSASKSGGTSSTGKGDRVGGGTSSASKGGSMAAGKAADRASVGGYSGQSKGSTVGGGTIGGGLTGGGTRAAGGAADRASVGNYAGGAADKGDRLGGSTVGAGLGREGTGGGPGGPTATGGKQPGYGFGKGDRLGPTTVGAGLGSDKEKDRSLASTIGGAAPKESRVTVGEVAKQDRLASMPTTDRFGPATAPATRGLKTATSLTSDVLGGLPASVVAGIQTPAMKAMPTSGVPDLASAPKAIWGQAAGFQRPTTDIVDRVRAAWASVLGADNVRITGTPHGGQRTSKKGSRSGRHGPTVGSALDYGVEVKTEQGWTSLNFGRKADLDLANRVAEVGAKQFGLKGYGVGNGYMGNVAIHHDIVSAPKSGAFEWTGPSAKSGPVNPSTRNTLAQARSDYESAKKAGVPTAQRSVASIMAGAPDEGTAIAALNRASGVSRPTAVASTTSTQPASAFTSPTTGKAPTTAAEALDAMTQQTTTTSAPRVSGYTKPATQTIDQTTTRATPKPGEYKRSAIDQAKATGIDVLTGAAGPIGLGINLATGVFLGTTLGGAVVDAAAGRWGANQYSPGDTRSRDPSGGDDRNGIERAAAERAAKLKEGTTAKTIGGESTSTAASSSNSFEEKYLNDTGRPTPEQKWDWTSSKYLGIV